MKLLYCKIVGIPLRLALLPLKANEDVVHTRASVLALCIHGCMHL